MDNFENENIPQAPERPEPPKYEETKKEDTGNFIMHEKAAQPPHMQPAQTAQSSHMQPAQTAQSSHMQPAQTVQSPHMQPVQPQNYGQDNQSLYRYKYTAGTSEQASKPSKPVKSKKAKKKKTKSGVGKKIVSIAAAAVLFGVVAGAAFQGVRYGSDIFLNQNNTKSESEPSDNTNDAVVKTSTATVDTVYDVEEVAELVMPSIVAINGTYLTTYEYWFQTYQQESKGAGSGIIIGEDEDNLLVVTNYHVVEDSTELSVTFIDGETVDATVKSYDETNDLAIVLVDLNDIKSSTRDQIKPITIGSSDDLSVGTPCVAIGNALGYGQSVTVGYVSALEREISVSDGTVTVLQTDAAINPGNSGGALVNMQGELIGINTAKYVDSQVEGMGYALPISDIEDKINYLIENDEAEFIDSQGGSAYLGIEPVEITSEYSASFGMPAGVYIKSVLSDTPAEDAGLQTGDIITAIDNTSISSVEELQETLAKYSSGDKVEITYYRNDGKSYSKSAVTVKLGARPSN